jgi:hypothetical protein
MNNKGKILDYVKKSIKIRNISLKLTFLYYKKSVAARQQEAPTIIIDLAGQDFMRS